MRASSELFAAEGFQDQTRASHALHRFMPLQPANPHGRRAIWHGHAGSGIDGGQFGIAKRLHDAVHASHADESLAARIQFPGDTTEGKLYVESFHGDAKEFGGWTLFTAFHMTWSPCDARISARRAGISDADAGKRSE